MENQTSPINIYQNDRYRDLIEGLNVITYEFDLTQRRFTYISRQAESILGYSSLEWMGTGFWFNHLHPDDKKWASEFSKRNTIQLHDHDYEYRMIASDGRIKWFRDITTVNSENGIPKTLQGVMIDISHRKQTEHELRESQERYRALVEQQTEMITRWKPDGTFTYVNDVFCNFFGKTRKELIGKTYIPAMPVEDLEKFSKFFNQLDIDNPVGIFTHRVILPDGEMRWLKWTDKAIFDDKGNIVEYQTVGRDITARKHAEEALKKSEEQFRSIFENAPIGMSLNSTTGEFLKVNCAFCKTTGYSSEELAGMTVREITHPDDIQLDKDALKSAIDNKIDNYELEKRYIRKDKEIVFVSIHVNIMRDSDGNPSQLVAQIVDITETRIAAEKLKDTQTRLAAILNNLPNVVFYENTAEKQFISPNVYEMLGYNSEDFYIDSALFDSLIHPDDIDRVVKGHNLWLKNGANGIYKELFRIHRKDDGYIWLEDHMFKVKRADGKSYVLGVMIDVTEQKNTEEKMSSSLEEKELLLKEIHHRVKNNLQVISSLLKLQANYVTDKEAYGVLTESQNRVQSMALIHQKLYQSKDLGNIDLGEYINQLALNIFHSYKVNTNVIRLVLDAKEIKIGIDYAIPCGLIVNELITNSLKHAFPNGKCGAIRININKENSHHYIISISDDGTGFPDKLDYKNTSSLGLQLVNTLVSQIDGVIDMDSYNGTSFTIKFSAQNETVSRI